MDQLERHRFCCRPFGEVSIASGQQMESVWRQLRLSDLHTRPGVCSVAGLIKHGAWSLLASLPSRCRPNKRLILHLNNHARTSRVDVLAIGQIHWATGARPRVDALKRHHLLCICIAVGIAAGEGLARLGPQLWCTDLHSCERSVRGRRLDLAWSMGGAWLHSQPLAGRARD